MVSQLLSSLSMIFKKLNSLSSPSYTNIQPLREHAYALIFNDINKIVFASEEYKKYDLYLYLYGVVKK